MKVCTFEFKLSRLYLQPAVVARLWPAALVPFDLSSLSCPAAQLPRNDQSSTCPVGREIEGDDPACALVAPLFVPLLTKPIQPISHQH